MDIPEVKAKMQQIMSAQWDEWLKQKIPSLGGKTPKQAVKTRDGRESVEALLLEARRHAMKNEKRESSNLRASKRLKGSLALT